MRCYVKLYMILEFHKLVSFERRSKHPSVIRVHVWISGLTESPFVTVIFWQKLRFEASTKSRCYCELVKLTIIQNINSLEKNSTG